MRLRYHWLRGKNVRTRDGRRVGRITDLVAEARGESLCVTTLLVGSGGFLRRLTFTDRPFLKEVQAKRIPWRLVAEIGAEVSLLVDHDELRAVLADQLDGPRQCPPEGRGRPA